MSQPQWVLKRRRYDGSDTVITRYSIKADAQDDADLMNQAYQSDRYYVEPYDPVKAANFTDDKLVNELAERILGGA